MLCESIKKAGNFKSMAVGLLLIALTLGGIFMASSPDGEAVPTVSSLAPTDLDVYRQELKDQLEELLSSVEGVGSVEVMLTLESTSQQIYAQNSQTTYDQNGSVLSGSGQWETVLVEGDSRGKTPLLLCEQMPKIRGVAVVCDGARDPTVCLKITQMISSLFGIRGGNISVIH